MGSLWWEDRAALWRVRETFRVSLPSPSRGVFMVGLSASFVSGPSDAACGEDVPRVGVSEPYGGSRSRRPPQPIGGQPEGKDLRRRAGKESSREGVRMGTGVGCLWGWCTRAGRACLVEGGPVRVTGSWRGSCASTLRARRASRIAFGPLPGRCAARFPSATFRVKRKGCPVRGSLGAFIV